MSRFCVSVLSSMHLPLTSSFHVHFTGNGRSCPSSSTFIETSGCSTLKRSTRVAFTMS